MPMPAFAKALWVRWKRIAHAIGTFQARVLLTVLYVVLLPPFTLIARLTADPMQLRRDVTPRWLVRPQAAAGLADGLAHGRRQFS
ncbi:MAG TPA: hypothetical protein VGM22_18180 [Methylomirabilota bacterium]|jgi:hypothetical protein